MPHQVFLSHAGEDAQLAAQVCRALEGAGIQCWIAPRDIPAGASYAGEIVRAIESSALFVLLYSRHAAESRHVRSELERAFNNNDPILPVRLEQHEIPTELQYFLSTAQWIDAFDSDLETELGGIVRSVREILSDGVLQPSRVHAWSRVLRHSAVPLFLVLAAAAAAALLWWPERAPTASGLPTDDSGQFAEQMPRINRIDGQKYVFIPAGRFSMGCSPGDSECEEDEHPAHSAIIASAFWMGETEVTVKAYRAYTRTSGLQAPEGDDRFPITGIDRAGAMAYCAWAGGRLPTEAEWEYAARGGIPEARYGPVHDIAWFLDNSEDHTHEVAQKLANAYGLYDALGNASEWVLDRYYNRYYEEEDGAVTEEPASPNTLGLTRGGSWAAAASSARASNRTELYPDAAERFVGFRCAADKM